MILQNAIIHRKEFEETDWTWLDEYENRLWGDGENAQEKSKPKTQREMLAELREQGLKKLREEQEEVVKPD